MTHLFPGRSALTSAILCLSLVPGVASAQTASQTPEGSAAPASELVGDAITSQPASPKPANDAVIAAPSPEADGAPENATPETAAQPELTPAPVPPTSLTVATWEGAYGEAQRIAVFDPFASRTGIAIKTQPHTDGARLRKSDTADKLDWDVAHIPADAAIAACKAGTVIALDDARPAADQFIAGAVGTCHVASAVWSSVIAVRPSSRWQAKPTTLADVFDPTSFPGKRAFPRQPRYLLETALMADGVAPAEVYATLATDAGLARAFARLEDMRPHIVWWRATNETDVLLAEKNVRFVLGFNGRFFNAFAGRKDAPRLIWDGQLYGLNAWVIPAKSKHPAAAKEFISAALQADAMRAQASRLPYGPTRVAAVAEPIRNDALGIDITPYLPTAPGNFSRALEINEAWWRQNEARLIDRFNAWLEGKTAQSQTVE
ncbi:MAG: extracellular solute-binding protein [Pseudomonadota bacterium]